MLELSDPTWRQFPANYTDGSHVAELLARAESGEKPSGWYDDLFQELCHQYTVSRSAYPSAPHLVRIAKAIPSLCKDLLVLLGACYAFLDTAYAGTIPAEMADEWRSSASEAITLLCDLLSQPQSTQSDLQYLLCSLAAVQGYPSLASAIEAIDVA